MCIYFYMYRYNLLKTLDFHEIDHINNVETKLKKIEMSGLK